MAIQARLYSENLGFPLCGSQDWIVMDSNNGCGSGTANGFGQFPSNVFQKQQQQVHMQQLQNHLQQRNQNLWFENASFPVSVPKNSYSQTVAHNITHPNSSMAAYSQSMDFQVEKHRQEIDQYLKLQVRRVSDRSKRVLHFVLYFGGASHCRLLRF